MVYNWLTTIHPCLLCESPIPRQLTLCEDCFRALPWIAMPCHRCGRPLPEGVGADLLCGDCLRTPPAYQASFIPFAYASPLAQLIKLLKFHQRLDLARGLAELMSGFLATRVQTLPEAVIPVPLHPKRMRVRGFNQALELARGIRSRLGVTVETRLVQRHRWTAEQSHLKLTERRRNVRGAFHLTAPNHYRHVAILDDVVTSGNTVNELSRTLRRAGVERVDVWSVCRTFRE